MCRYVQGKFRELYRASIGIVPPSGEPTSYAHPPFGLTGADFLTKELLVDDTIVYLQVWDTGTLHHYYPLPPQWIDCSNWWERSGAGSL
jgi:hypothetical protein